MAKVKLKSKVSRAFKHPKVTIALQDFIAELASALGSELNSTERWALTRKLTAKAATMAGRRPQ